MVEDRLGWAAAETQQMSAGTNRRRLDQMHGERKALSDAATEVYIASRLQSEQMKRVVEGMTSQVETERERRLQAVSDDRFLARRRWSDSRERVLVDRRDDR